VCSIRFVRARFFLAWRLILSGLAASLLVMLQCQRGSGCLQAKQEHGVEDVGMVADAPVLVKRAAFLVRQKERCSTAGEFVCGALQHMLHVTVVHYIHDNDIFCTYSYTRCGAVWADSCSVFLYISRMVPYVYTCASTVSSGSERPLQSGQQHIVLVRKPATVRARH
jgi:hypothetical protein